MDEQAVFVCRSQWFRRTDLEKSLGAEPAPHQLVDRLAVDRLSRELRHDRLHDLSHIFGRIRTSVRNRGIDGALDNSRIGRRRQVGLEDRDLSRFLVGKILASALEEGVDGITALLDQRLKDLLRFAVVQGSVLVIAALFILVNLATDLLYGVLNPRLGGERT